MFSFRRALDPRQAYSLVLLGLCGLPFLAFSGYLLAFVFFVSPWFVMVSPIWFLLALFTRAHWRIFRGQTEAATEDFTWFNTEVLAVIGLVASFLLFPFSFHLPLFLCGFFGISWFIARKAQSHLAGIKSVEPLSDEFSPFVRETPAESEGPQERPIFGARL